MQLQRRQPPLLHLPDPSGPFLLTSPPAKPQSQTQTHSVPSHPCLNLARRQATIGQKYKAFAPTSCRRSGGQSQARPVAAPKPAPVSILHRRKQDTEVPRVLLHCVKDTSVLVVLQTAAAKTDPVNCNQETVAARQPDRKRAWPAGRGTCQGPDESTKATPFWSPLSPFSVSDSVAVPKGRPSTRPNKSHSESEKRRDTMTSPQPAN